VPYWFRGFCDLGFVLGDKRIIEESKPYFEAMFASQREDGYFGPRSNLGDGRRGPDLMPNMSMLAALQCYYEYTGDQRAIELMTRYFRWELTIPDDRFFAGGWQVPRGGDNMASTYWLYNRTGDKWLLDLAAHRSIIAPSRHRHTRRVRSRTPEPGDSIRFVVARHRRNVPGRIRSSSWLATTGLDGPSHVIVANWPRLPASRRRAGSGKCRR
jgi:hypothetical protein